MLPLVYIVLLCMCSLHRNSISFCLVFLFLFLAALLFLHGIKSHNFFLSSQCHLLPLKPLLQQLLHPLPLFNFTLFPLPFLSNSLMIIFLFGVNWFLPKLKVSIFFLSWNPPSPCHSFYLGPPLCVMFFFCTGNKTICLLLGFFPPCLHLC